MSGIVIIRDKISARVTDLLAAASYPPLVDGKILLGRAHQYEQSSPPRIIMTPMGSRFGGKDVYTSRPGLPYGAEALAQIAQRARYTDFKRFEFRCWGTATVTDPATQRDQDFDATEALYDALLSAIWDVAGPFTRGGIEIEDGAWTDATFASSQQIGFGREFVFNVTIATPVLDQLLPFAPPDVHAVNSIKLQVPSGAQEAP